MKYYLLIFLSVFLSTLVSAAPTNEHMFSIINAETGDPIKDVSVHFSLSAIDHTENVSKIIYNRNGDVSIPLASIEYYGEIILDSADTPAPDYYFSGKITLGDEDTIVFIPIAQVRGTVLDTLDNLVGGAEIFMDCQKLNTISFPQQTDKYGSFSTYVPVGACSVAVATNKNIGKNTFTSTQGESITLTITLAETGRNVLLPLSIIILFIILFIAYKFLSRKKKKPTTKKIPSKIQDISKTLNTKEQAIVQHLIEHKNTASAAQVRQALKIPKTTLSRLLVSLEQKNIITLERHSKRKTIKLADWLKKK